MRSFVGLEEAVREQVGTHLFKLFATTEDLLAQCRSAKYNVRGQPDRGAVEAICDLTATVLLALQSPVRERMEVLGLPVNYTLRAIADASELEEFPLDLQDVREIAALIGQSWADVSQLLTEKIGAIRELGDGVGAHELEHAQMAMERQSKQLLSLTESNHIEEAAEMAADLGKESPMPSRLAPRAQKSLRSTGDDPT